jgi:cytochrome c oxidase assembly protein subunit 15
MTQGILGGITVLWFLPAPISIAHASLAQLVFCMTVTIALATSPGWRRGYEPAAEAGPPAKQALSGPAARQALPGHPEPALHVDDTLRRMTIATTVAIYAQIVIGATMRHTEAGLAIPDFPLAFGQLVPPHWDARIAVHYAHRVGALIVTVLILASASRVFRLHWRRVELRRPSMLLLVLVTIQITLGAMTVLLNRPYIINSLHVVTGASVLVTALVLALRAHRQRFDRTVDTPVGRAA